MRIRVVIFILLQSIIYIKCKSAGFSFSGPLQSGLQNTLLTNNSFTGLSNPSLLSENKFGIGIGAQRIYNLSNLTDGLISGYYKINKISQVSGGIFIESSNEVYSVKKGYLGYGIKLNSEFSMGVNAGYYQYNYFRYDPNNIINGGLYFTYKTNKKSDFAISINNVKFYGTQSSDKRFNQALSTTASYSYLISKEFKFYTELTQKSASYFILSGAMNYTINPNFSLVLGLRNIPANVGNDDILITSGLQITTKQNIKISLAFEFFPILGVSSSSSLEYIKPLNSTTDVK